MLWATKQLISLNLCTLHNATAHYRPIRHYNALLTEVYWCKSTRKRYPGAKKTGGEIVQALWQFSQFTKSLWGEVIHMSMCFWQYGADFFQPFIIKWLRFPLMMLWWPFLQHEASCSVSTDVINNTICLIIIRLACNSLLYFFLPSPLLITHMIRMYTDSLE